MTEAPVSPSTISTMKEEAPCSEGTTKEYSKKLKVAGHFVYTQVACSKLPAIPLVTLQGVAFEH